mmetsp:Transcript_17496/g.31587  ORF Transcript_17496/g.31587 Transcript_17496/m.31587 type:complete len:2291 (-) Transcript_17496:3251-10123(-)
MISVGDSSQLFKPKQPTTYPQVKIVLILDVSTTLLSLGRNELLIYELISAVKQVLDALATLKTCRCCVLLLSSTEPCLQTVAQDSEINLQLSQAVNQAIRSTISNFGGASQANSHPFKQALKLSLFALDKMNPEALPQVLMISDGINCSLELNAYQGVFRKFMIHSVGFSLLKLATSGKEFGYFEDLTQLTHLAISTQGRILSSAEDLSFLKVRNQAISREYGVWTTLEEYKLTIPAKVAICNRLEEGFGVLESSTLHFQMTPTCCLEYSIIEDRAKIRISAKSHVLKMISEQNKAKRSTFYNMVHATIQSIKEADRQASLVLALEKSWHEIKNLKKEDMRRWARIDSIELYTEKNIEAVKFSLKEKLHSWSQTAVEGEFFVRQKDFVKVTQIGACLIVLTIGTFEMRSNIFAAMIHIAKQLDCVALLKPLSELLVKYLQVSKSKGNRNSHIIPSIRQYLKGHCTVYSLSSEFAAKLFLKALGQRRKEEGFYWLGYCDKDCILYFKMTLKGTYIQYYAEVKDNTVEVWLYWEPEDDLELKLEASDSRLQQLFTTHCLYLKKCLGCKLREDDSDFYLSADDDTYPYLKDPEWASLIPESLSYGERTLEFYEYLQDFYRKMEVPQTVRLTLEEYLSFFKANEVDWPSDDSREFKEKIIAVFNETSDWVSAEGSSLFFWRFVNFDKLLTIRYKAGVFTQYFCNMSLLVNGTNHCVAYDYSLELYKRKYMQVLSFEIAARLRNGMPCLDTLHILAKQAQAKLIVNIKSNLQYLVSAPSTSADSLAYSLAYYSVVSQGREFAAADSAFDSLLMEKFIKLSCRGCYINHCSDEVIFIRLGNCASSLTKAASSSSSFELKAYIFSQSDSFEKETSLLKTDTNSNFPDFSRWNGTLDNLKSAAEAELSKVTLELLKRRPLTSKLVNEALILLKNDRRSCVKLYSPKLLTRNLEDALRLLKQELNLSKEINLVEVGGHFVLVATPDHQDFTVPEEEQKEGQWVPFWCILDITSKSEVQAVYSLPNYLCDYELDDEAIDAKLQEAVSGWERVINQRILLKQLLHTGDCSELLFASREEPSFTRSRSSVFDKRKKKVSKDKALGGFEPEQFRPPLLYYNDFAISDRLQFHEARISLNQLFSRAPFEIFNRQDMFQLSEDENKVYLFRFVEINPSEIQKDSAESNFCSQFVRLHVFGIDDPSKTVLEELEGSVRDQLQQASLFKLADCLNRSSQKHQMPLQDVHFIRGNQKPLSLFFPLPEVVSDHYAFIAYLLQVFSKFLTCYSVNELQTSRETKPNFVNYNSNSSVLLYNFLSPLEPKEKSSTRIVFRKESMSLLGNIFGKALALVYLDITFFDGESLKEIDEFPRPDNELYIPEQLYVDGEDLAHQYRSKSVSYPVQTGYYTELKLYVNGPANLGIFIETIEQSVNEAMAEFCCELLYQQNPMLPKLSQVPFFIDTFRCQTKRVSHNIRPVPHYQPMMQRFSFFMKLIEHFESKARGRFPYQLYVVADKKTVASSGNPQDLRKAFELCKANPSTLLVLVAASRSQEDLQLYDNMKFDKFSVPRTLLGLFIVTNEHLEVLGYNVCRQLLTELTDAIDKEVHWAHQRHTILNNILTQKLGLFHHVLHASVRSPKSKDDSIVSLFAKGCMVFQPKEQWESYSSKDLVSKPFYNPKDTDYDERNLSQFKMQYLYPQVKHNQLSLADDNDPVKRHGKQFMKILDLKQDLAQNCRKIADAYKIWGGQVPGALAKLQSHSNFGLTKEGNLAAEVIRQARLFHLDRAKLNLVFPDQITELVRARRGTENRIDPESEENKMQWLLNSILTAYANRVSRLISQLEIVQPKESRIIRKGSTDVASFLLTSSENKRFGSLNTMRRELIRQQAQLFMRRVQDQSFLIVELAYEDGYFSSAAFCLENAERVLPFVPRDDRQPNADLRKQIQRIKTQLRSPSFLYDQQLHQLCLYLRQPKNFPNLDLLSSLTAIKEAYNAPPQGSSSWLYSGTVKVDLGRLQNVSPKEIFKHLLHNSADFNYGAHFSNRHDLLFTVKDQSNEPVYLEKPRSNSSIMSRSINRKVSRGIDSIMDDKNQVLLVTVYTVIEEADLRARRGHISLIKVQEDEPESENTLLVRYFLIRDDSSIKRSGKEIFKNVKMKAEAELGELLQATKIHQRRDALWEKIRDPSSDITPELFYQLREHSLVRRCQDLDKRLEMMVGMRGVVSSRCFDYVAEVYGRQCRRFESQDALHMAVFSGASLLVHISVTHKERQLSLFTVKKTERVTEEEERNFLTQIVKRLLHWLWTRLTTS